MRRILVTGGAGFIGSHLVRHLLEDEQTTVINLDALTYAGNRDNLIDVQANARYRFVHGDICDRELVQRLAEEVDIIVNCAAQTHVDRSISGPETFTHTNVMGTQTMLEAARTAHNGKGVARYIQISTDEVYGTLPLEGGQPFSETTPLEPSSPYSASKAGADLLALSYYTTYGLHVNITRCSNNYGPNQYPEKLMPLFILNAMADKNLPVYGDGLNVRDWIHVVDHARAVGRVIADGKPGEVYNVGADNEWNNLAITKEILRLTGKPESLITYVTDRLGHDRRYAIDSSKIQRELGWRPQIAFDQGLAETVAWYQHNSDWVAHVQERKLLEEASSLAQQPVLTG